MRCICSGFDIFALVLGCCGLLLLAGCSKRDPRLGKDVSVQGKVMLGNQPLTGGGVRFHAVVEKGSNAAISVPLGAKLQENGSYSLKVPVGKYCVQLDRGDKADKQLWSQVPLKYTSHESTLLVEVAEDKPPGGYDLNLSPETRKRRR